MKTKLTSRTVTNVKNYDFCAADSKGRSIGAVVTSFEETFEEASADANPWHTEAPGHYFGYRPHSTRSTAAYGALQREQLFKTAEERDAAIEKYLAGARKRAAKK